MDFTTQWVWAQRNKKHLGTFIVVLVAFGAGWQLGKVSSPYYASHPIVFEDKECPGNLSSGGSKEELVQLKEDSTVAQRTEKTKEAEASVTPNGANVAGVISEATPSANTSAGTTTEKRFVGSVNSNLFHDPSCAAAKRIKEANQIWFASVEEAQKAGYEPSQCTKEKLGL